MGYTAEGGNFEGRSRARGGFGNETGQTERRGRSGAAEKANRDAINKATTLSGPRGPFKSPVYDLTPRNALTLGRMVGPMLANPGIGLAASLGAAILSGDIYGAFGRPTGWSSYSPRDIDPMGANPRGSIGGRDPMMASAERRALLAELLRRQKAARPKPPAEADIQPQPQYVSPATISDHVPGLAAYGTGRPAYQIPLPRTGKAAGYGGTARQAPSPYLVTYR
jgi:hypothetical protein